MLYKYKCKIKPLFHSEIFTFFDEHLWRGPELFNKWFYFYINQPHTPVVVWKLKQYDGYQLQPGYNRYIGTALRCNNDLIDGIFITDSDDLSNISKEIEIIELVEISDLSTDSYQITLDDPAHVWGIGNQSINGDAVWYPPVQKWINCNLRYKWGIEIKDKIWWVNNSKGLRMFWKRTQPIIKASDFLTTKTAVKHFFELIKNTENL